jgi:hypothetical protein
VRREAPTRTTFEIGDRDLLLAGESFRILSGAIHYEGFV